MKQQILFDLDDTLIYCNKYFFFVVDQFVDSMTTWFQGYEVVTADSVREMQHEIDVALIGNSGFKSEHFPQSFIDTYAYYSDLTGRKRSAVEVDFLWKLGLGVYEHQTEPYPHMEQTLDALAEAGHELHLYTGGELLIQRRKIEQMNLERYFGSRIYIRQLKNNDALEQILKNSDFDRKHTWMIGNSIRTDVVPALTAGIHAIHMRTLEEWQYNVIGINVQPKGAFLTLDHLQDVPPAIHRFIGK
ncbi:HAD family hydrolase [Paenibacillus sp. MY03]|uniref:Haloacid dehalogenase n=1 Tax=Paenibacillus agaridevorans TaxID=171404 RepID=A0A2R5EP76_9BACL|nr:MULTISPECIES: HAD family hydrolase [Paenibacillus]OUS75319.1 HAD family hydrolase [Paenibacillus sp. MY03]GBG07905.1 haloacid dehalogenase [Paenibacillus agaridevorans]